MKEVLIGSILSALATGLGALPILFFKNMSHYWRDVLLAFTAGIMVSASTFSLIPEALAVSNIYIVVFGIILGTFVLSLLEKNIPHLDLEHREVKVSLDNKTLLIILALTLHNIPEGLSVGVAYAANDDKLGGLIAFAIGLQNAPEGLLIALFLITQNMSKAKALIIATLTGAIEIFSGLFGFFLSNYITGLVPYGLSFAAGAMLFIIYKELIPESHGDGHERSSTYAFIIGLVLMLFLVNKL